MIKLFKAAGSLAIMTEAVDEREFLEKLSALLSQAIDDEAYAGDWEFQLQRWLPQAVDICCKLRGYKAENVREKRVLIAGDCDPWPSCLTMEIDEKGVAHTRLQQISDSADATSIDSKPT